MTERKYSVSELDGLRNAIEHKWLWGSYRNTRLAGNTTISRSFNENDKTKAVEELVRTHMLAGHTAEDLYASEHSTRDTADSNNQTKGTEI